MVKTITDTVVEEEKFIEEAFKILKSLGHLNFGLNKKMIFKMMKEKGYSKGYNGTWFMSDDVNSETDPIA